MLSNIVRIFMLAGIMCIVPLTYAASPASHGMTQLLSERTNPERGTSTEDIEGASSDCAPSHAGSCGQRHQQVYGLYGIPPIAPPVNGLKADQTKGRPGPK